MSSSQLRRDGRRPDQMRPVRITRRYLKHPEGSCLIEMGDTRVICTATLESGVPNWLEGAGRGWVTAEYAMLPRATQTRTPREGRTGRPPGRTMEIQRLIGRSLRAVCDLDAFDNHRITVDCDVIQADGGTRAASITGGYVALRDALAAAQWAGGRLPLLDCVVGLSAGVVANRNLLDLCYLEDSEAAVDMTFAFTGEGLLVEVQGTGEGRPFAAAEMTALLEMTRPAAATLTAMVKQLFDRDLPSIRTHDGT